MARGTTPSSATTSASSSSLIKNHFVCLKEDLCAPSALVVSPTGLTRGDCVVTTLFGYHCSANCPLLGHYLGFFLSSGHVQAMLMARTRKYDAMFTRINKNSFGRAKAVCIR